MRHCDAWFTSSAQLIDFPAPAMIRFAKMRFSVVALAALLLSGCMMKPVRPVNADGTYCYEFGKPTWHRLTCTPGPIPPAAVEAQAMRFQADAAALTVYVVRRRWADTKQVVPVKVDGRPEALPTIPRSLLRLRLSPGAHRLAFDWQGRSFEMCVEGAAGDVRFVELVGASWFWGTTFEWEAGDPEAARRRAVATKLVGDVDLGR